MGEPVIPHRTEQAPPGQLTVAHRSPQDRRAAPWSARTERVLSWIGWHLGELAGVAVPAALAVTTHPLWAIPAAVVAAGWGAHEVRRARGKTRGKTEQAGGERA